MRRLEASSTVGPACLQPAPCLVRASLSDNTLTRLEGSQQSSRHNPKAYQTRLAAGLRDTIWGCVDRSDPFSAARFRG